MNWEASGLGSLKGLQPEDPGGLGRGGPERSDPPPAWQEVRGESRELPAHRRDKVGAGGAGAGGDLREGGNNQNLLPFNSGGVAVHLQR